MRTDFLKMCKPAFRNNTCLGLCYTSELGIVVVLMNDNLSLEKRKWQRQIARYS